MSMGRLMPAMTSTLARSSTEIARFEGVPPNMSVSSTTPSPSSTFLMLSRMSRRRTSMSSSGPMQTAAMRCCGPTTCSSAAMNSVAKRPWVTRTIPIIIDLPLVLEIFSSRFVDREAGVAVPDADDAVVGGEPAGEPLGDEHRTVAAAGAADRDRDVTLALALEARQQRQQQRGERCEERRISTVALD